MALGRQFAETLYGVDLNKGTEKHVKGAFTDERNYAIACRFHYHFELKGMRYERAIHELHKEFFLSELRVAQLIMQQGESLKELKATNADGKALAKKLPQFNWN